MVNLVLKFVSCSRAAGLRISTSEVLDCFDQLNIIDFLDEPQFAAVLRANFAKSRREQFHFNRLYDLFFHELRQESNIAQAEPLSDQVQNILQSLTSGQDDDGAFQAVLDFLNGDPLSFFEQMQPAFAAGNQAGGGMSSNLGPMIQRLSLMLQINAAGDALANYLIDQRDHLPWEIRRDLKALFDTRLASARRLLTQERRPFDEKIQKTNRSRNHQQPLSPQICRNRLPPYSP